MNQQASSFALETFLPYRLVRIAERVSQDFAAIYRRRYGLSRPEWRCLAALGQFGTVTAKEIVAHSAMRQFGGYRVQKLQGLFVEPQNRAQTAQRIFLFELFESRFLSLIQNLHLN